MYFNQPIQYEPPVYRPPSEWNSLLIQLTIGCSNNMCTYCDMYRSKTYRVRPLEEIKQEIKKCFNQGLKPEKIFLCDGDALGAPMEILESVVDEINRYFPDLRRMGIYATAENILSKSNEELARLASKKLNMAYLGLESGSDKILHMVVKGNTRQDMIDASLKIKTCGWSLSTIAMLGIGGEKLSQEHIDETASMISLTGPHFFSFLTTFAIPGTPYYRMVQRGTIKPLSSKKLLLEMYEILKKASFDLNPVLFRANHVSNSRPIGGRLPLDKQNILEILESWIQNTPEGIFPKPPKQM